MDELRFALAPAAAGHWPLEVLFDRVPYLTFFVKDVQGRYVIVNETLMRRSGAQHKAQVLGRTAAEVFSGEAGQSFSAQDLRAISEDREFRDVLELYFDAQGQPIWCLTHKLPLHNGAGQVVGLAGLSRDIPPLAEQHEDFHRVSAALAYLHDHFAEPLRVLEVAAQVGLSADTFERLVQRVCHLTPKQLLLKLRFDAAVRLLQDVQLSVAQVAHACGYSDHSAFTRKFQAVTGLSPRLYRQRLAESGGGGALSR